MDNIIQLIATKVKQEIEENIIKVLEGSINLDNIVESVGEMVNSIGIDTLIAIIKEVNLHIKTAPERKGKYHLQRNNDKRSLITRFGLLEFERDYYKNIKENNYTYILDKLLEMEKYERVLTAHLGSLDNPIDIDKPLWKSLRVQNKEHTIELIDFAIEETPFKTKRESMKRAKRYILNNCEGIRNLFGEEKYKCSAEGHISHILSARLSSRPMGWSLIGADEMARLRAYKANGGSIKGYYSKLRTDKKVEERIIKLDKRVINKVKKTYASINPDIMTDMPYTSRTDGKWLKNMLEASSF